MENFPYEWNGHAIAFLKSNLHCANVDHGIWMSAIEGYIPVQFRKKRGQINGYNFGLERGKKKIYMLSRIWLSYFYVCPHLISRWLTWSITWSTRRFMHIWTLTRAAPVSWAVRLTNFLLSRCSPCSPRRGTFIGIQKKKINK